MIRPRAILFDHDGVLVESESRHREAWRLLCVDLGLIYDDALIRGAVGRTAPQIMAELLDRQRPGWDPHAWNLQALGDQKNVHYRAIIQTKLTAYPGVHDGLEWCRDQGVRLAVVSNARRSELEAGLSAAGLFEFFELRLSRDDLAAPKPDPLSYLTAAAQLEVAPADCLGVEDSPTGLEALLLGKIPAAAVTTNFPASALATPIPGRPDLKPTWLGLGMIEFFAWFRGLPTFARTP